MIIDIHTVVPDRQYPDNDDFKFALPRAVTYKILFKWTKKENIFMKK
jgi:hypothetical protein